MASAAVLASSFLVFCSIALCTCRPMQDAPVPFDDSFVSSNLEAPPTSKRTPAAFLPQDYRQRIADVDQDIHDLLQHYTNLIESTVGKEKPSDEWIPISRLIRNQQ